MRQVLVTGANKGIGFAVVEAILCEQPDCGVILGARNLQRGKAARDTLLAADPAWADRLRVVQLDVASDRSVADANAACPPLHGLVNNAGMATGSLADILDVNVHGIRRMCNAFASLMDAGARIINVTSAAGPNFVSQCAPRRQAFFLDPDIEWEQLESFMTECITREPGGWSTLGISSASRYGLSKACANSYTQCLARRHPKLVVNACTPGFIETDLGRDFLGGRTPAEAGMKTAAQGARVIMHLLFGDLAGTGYYYGSDSLRSPMDRYRAPGAPAYTGD